MSFIVKDRVKETSTSTGLGSFTLAGPQTGFQAFSAVCANGDTVWYCIANRGVTEWETGVGTWSTGGILARSVIFNSSNSNLVVNFSAGTKDVFLTFPAEAFNSTQILQRGAFAIPHAQVLTLPTVGYQIMPADPNTAYLPEWGTYHINAGAAYTGLGTTYFGILLADFTNRLMGAPDSGSATFFGSSAEGFAGHQGVGNSQVGTMYGNVLSAGNFNLALAIRASGGVPYTGGAERSLTGIIWFRIFRKGRDFGY